MCQNYFSDTADPWANKTSEQIIEELKKTIYSLESKFVALTPHLEYPVPVIFSDHVMALRQVRFPKSKKKRIRKKWSQREINFASRPGCYLIQNKINIFRLDVTSSYFSYLDNLIYTEKMYDKKNYIFKKNTIKFVSQGIVGQKNDIIVDDVNNPKLIYGICDGKGNFFQMSNLQKEQEIKKIYKLTGFKLIYE